MGVEITGPMHERYGEILTPEAVDVLARLHREFDGRRLELLERGEFGETFAEARTLFMEVAVADDFVDFLTLPAYERMP